MPNTLDIPLSDIKFPSSCVVCLSPSSKRYTFEKTFNYGRRSYTVKVPAPMCGQHFDAANTKGLLESLFAGLAIYGGILAGILTAFIMFSRWEGDFNIVGKLIGSSIFGFGGFILFWLIMSVSIAPIFATPASKEARNAVEIAFYWPQTNIVRLTFKNETIFTLTQKENLA